MMKKLYSPKSAGTLFIICGIVFLLFAAIIAIAFFGFVNEIIPEGTTNEENFSNGVGAAFGLVFLLFYFAAFGIFEILLFVAGGLTIKDGKKRVIKTGSTIFGIVTLVLHILAYAYLAFVIFAFFQNVPFVIACFAPVILAIVAIVLAFKAKGNAKIINQKRREEYYE